VTRLLFKRYLVSVEPILAAAGVLVLALGAISAAFLWPSGDTTERAAAGAPAPQAVAGRRAEGGAKEANAPARAREERLTLTFLGDIMAHSVNYRMADYARIYADVREHLQNDDATFANLETPVVENLPYRTYPRFNVKPPYARAAVEAGIEVFSAANNHATDYGAEGVAATREALADLAASHGLASSGLRAEGGEDFSVTELRIGGKLIGFVAVAQLLNDPTGGELVYTVDYADRAEARRFLSWVSGRAETYDLFIVSYHGGTQYRLSPEPAKAQFFEELVAAGADVVWSHHPHVVQPWRHIERAGGEDALILSSTGNFISGQTWHLGPQDARAERAYTGDTALFRVHVEWDARGALRVRHEPILVSNYRHPEHGMIVRRLDALVESDIPSEWKRYYVMRRNALREITWKSRLVRVARLD
jgi:poly-gamma-glutamate synthesis protein (capsule biosynthesis protein)